MLARLLQSSVITTATRRLQPTGTHLCRPCRMVAPCALLHVGNLFDKTTKDTIAIGGHRGCGENLLEDSHVEPACRENTVRSFQQAAAMGVTFVEFDVQVTRDGTPVLWHDDSIITEAESPEPGSPTARKECEVKDLTLNQFQGLVEKETGSADAWQTQVVRHFRSKRKGPIAGDKPWVCDQDDKLPTLRDVFKALPEHIGFDIEVKMTLPHTVEVTPPEEQERVVAPILACVEECMAGGSGRTIMFSSFDPDICIKLARSQSKYPVMFLSGCGIYEHVDARRTSIQAAIDVAAGNGLAGIVVPASIPMANPGMVGDAAARGLRVLTYGLDNDDLACIQKQQELGVHAAIVDDVAHVMPQLRPAATAQAV